MGAKMVPFAGWEMPVWYTSVNEEHIAVRKGAGLFDVAHMGVFEVVGPNATIFLDTVFSNYVAWLEDGQSLYGFFLKPDGSIIDDGIIYRVSPEYYYIVINAANARKDWDWLNAVNNREVLIDEDRPWLQVSAQAILRDLKDPASGDRQKCDLALQGPASLKTLQALAEDNETKSALSRLRRTEMLECVLDGIPLVVARTGYTGESWGFEILIHPNHLAQLWWKILDVGDPFGVKPAGLACRDSTRIEAGLPLYGHELAGSFEISPIEAGFPGYVKYHKPFFIGRKALLLAEKDRKRELIRFKVDDKNVRLPCPGDPVVNRMGKHIGHVTSCSIDLEKNLVGLAILEKRYNEPGTPISIFSLQGKSLDEALLRRSRVSMPFKATVHTRFPEGNQGKPPWAREGD
jgi:glycine hydroxymethyltransferase